MYEHSETLASRQVDDYLQIAGWRTERLLALGYELPRAASLGKPAIEIQQLERLIAKACPREPAIRIAA